VEGLYPPGSVTRRINREQAMLLGGGRALLMQLAHPGVAAAVDEHSDFEVDPLRRLNRTLELTLSMVFGTRQEALAAVRTINRTHRAVRGRGYHALDPELLLWVHATLVDSGLLTYRTFVGELSLAEAEAFYQESKPAGELLGIPLHLYPADLRDFRGYLQRMLEGGPLRVDARARRLAGLVLRPRLRLVPGFAFVPFEVVTAGLLPAGLRRDYGLAWGGAQRAAFALARAVVPRLVRVTPPALRLVPAARRTQLRLDTEVRHGS